MKVLPLLLAVEVFCIDFILCKSGKQHITTKSKPWKPQHFTSHSNQCQSDSGPLILTPYIKSGNIKKAQKLSAVYLWRSEIPSYSGYLTVNDTDNSNMFFWFFPAEVEHPEQAPVVLWLQGGPGASSMFALFVENGPFRIKESMKLTMRPERWTKLANMIYIDNPVGTGFSFTDSEDGYSRNEIQVGKNLYQALLQFYTMFPQFQDGDFYVTGESYGGKYVPAISYRIHLENPAAAVKIPLRGLAIGNGLVDPGNMMHYGDLLYEMGMLDEEERDVFHSFEDAYRKAISEKRWRDAFNIFDVLLNGDKTPYPPYFYNVTHSQYYFNILQTVPPANFDYYSKYLEECFVREAIHVGGQVFSNGSLVEDFMLEDIAQSTAGWLSILTDNYRVMIYNGQLDIICGLPLTESYLYKLQWSGAAEYKNASKVIWKVDDADDEVAGYVRYAKNFVQVAVRSAGHMVPYDQPRAAFDMIRRFLSAQKFSN